MSWLYWYRNLRWNYISRITSHFIVNRAVLHFFKKRLLLSQVGSVLPISTGQSIIQFSVLLANTWWTRWPKEKICLIARWNYIESRDGSGSWATFPYLSLNLFIFFKWFSLLLFQLVKDYKAWASGDASRKPLGTGEIWSCPVAPLGMIVYSLSSVITPSFV